MNRFSIKDIENLTGIKAHTIRIWEQRYGILQPKRTQTNIRFYDGNDLKSALRIALLNQYGYKISKIQQMSDTDISSLIGKINDSDFKLQAQVNELLDATLAMDTDRFEGLLNQHIKKSGLEYTIEHLIFQFLEKVGIMWVTDNIFPAQEHLVSNIILQKVLLGIEHLPAPIDGGNAASVLLFLPEGEIHDLSLTYVRYQLKKNNKKAIYLGANTPLLQAKAVHDVKMPTHIYVHLTSIAEDFDANKYLTKLGQVFYNSTVLVSGKMLRYKKFNVPGNMRLLYNLHEVKQMLQSI
jgi:MerR family transcriptional regulator, light-induced transcriptional regulator